MNRRHIIALAASGAALLLGGCSIIFPERYRYRLTVEVETPQGLATGSAVHEIKASDILIKLVDGDQGYVGFRGEAVAVDLPNGQTLFALVSSANPGEESLIPAVQSAFDPAYERGAAGNLASARKMADAPDGTTAELRPTTRFEQQDRPFYPLLVRFRDIADPRSIEQVNPDAFAAVFGRGYALRRITVTITDDGVTRTLEKRLRWMDRAQKSNHSYFIGSFRNAESAPKEGLDELVHQDLIREFK